MKVSPAAADAIGGAGGGMVALIATYPLITINTRQVNTQKLRQAKDGDEVEEKQEQPSWTLASLYDGIQPAIAGTVMSQSVYYYMYSWLRQVAVDIKRRGRAGPGRGSSEAISVPASLAVAALAGCANVLTTIPIWVIVTRVQAQRVAAKGGRPAGVLASIQDLYAEAGILGFWRGLIPTLVMVSNPTIQFVIFEWLTGLSNRRRRAAAAGGAAAAAAATALEVFAMGAIAKLGATVATYPLQVVKSRLQASNRATADSMRYKGTMDAFYRIAAEEGVGGLYKGMGTKITQSVTAAALLFTFKDKISNGVKDAFLEVEEAPPPPA